MFWSLYLLSLFFFLSLCTPFSIFGGESETHVFIYQLVEDTEVFQESIGENPSGGKISTYKELCSLANEMGQPDLIYKFMDLANHQASLNSKRGAAFGFSKIAKQAEDALKPYLHSLIPRLVRYQYDPDKNVQVIHMQPLMPSMKSTVNLVQELTIDCIVFLIQSYDLS